MKDKNSRHIPLSVKRAIQNIHYFECAWCGTQLFDHHHIEEFSKGGKHSIDNLILLCPNCHRQVHNGEIPLDALIKRTSTHLKGDRLSYTINFDQSIHEMKIGSNRFLFNGSVITANGHDVFNLINRDGRYYPYVAFCDSTGILIFWMSSNRYWAPNNFSVTVSDKYMVIESIPDNLFIKIKQISEYVLELRFNIYVHNSRGQIINISTHGDSLKIGGIPIEGYTALNNKGAGIAIY